MSHLQVFGNKIFLHIYSIEGYNCWWKLSFVEREVFSIFLEKQARFGIMLYLLCESDSGYVWSFFIYTGKGTNLDPRYSTLPVSLTVMTLLDSLLDQGYCLAIYNFYTSTEVANLLISHWTNNLWNIESVPEALKRTTVKRGDIKVYQRGKFFLIHWKDKKDLTLYSTIHNS